MTKELDVDFINAICGHITELLEKIPDYGSEQYNNCLRDVQETLEIQYNARFAPYHGYVYKMRMVGISTSCTSGIPGLLSNWRSAARRKITQQSKP
jgi:hypothetical protein